MSESVLSADGAEPTEEVAAKLHSGAKAETRKKYLHAAVTILLIFGANFIPTIAPLTAYGTKIVVLFCGIIYGYTTMGLLIPSFLAILSLGFTGFDTVPNTMMRCLGNSTVLYVFGITIMAQLLVEVGLTDKMINWLVTRPIAKGRPWVISFFLMLAAYLAAWMVNMLVPCIVLWSILKDLFEKVGYKKGDKWSAVMMFGVLFTSSVGSYVAPFQMGVVANYGMLTAASNGALALNFSSYFAWAFVVGTLLFVFWFLFERFAVRPDVRLLSGENLFEEDKTHYSH